MPSIPSDSRWSAHRTWLLAIAPVVLFVACVSADRISGLKLPQSSARDLAKGGGVVISQIYGAGGNSGAVLKNDYVELHNSGSITQSVEGWSIQYASASGTGNFAAAALHGSIPAGGYYLVQLAGGSVGASIPTADATGTLNLSGTTGKVALVNQATGLACNGNPTGSTPCSAEQLTHIIDLVGFGGATFFEGAVAPAPSTTTAIFRKLAGNQDTDDNSADFVAGDPAPRNSASPPSAGGAVVAGPFDHVAVSGGTSVERGRTIILTAALQDANNLGINDPDAVFTWTSTDETVARVTGTSGNTATITGIAEGGPVTINVSATSHTHTHASSSELTVVPRVLGHVTLSSSAPMPLVIGYQTVLFVGGTDDSGIAVDFKTVTWSSTDPTVASVDSRGLVTAAGDGTAVIKATAPDGSVGSFTINTEVPFYSSSARSGHNTEFGVPTDADASNDVIIARKQYTLSYNPQRGGPNWVSWDLSASHLGSRNRCNCYSADTALARLGYSQYMYSTVDYTGSGYDRGHMEPSADQTTTDGENATTFFMTNFLAQKHGLNAGPWENLENDLRDSVKAGREAYIIAGGTFTNGVGLGTVNNAGKIAIPDSTWKIVVMLPAGTGLANVTSASDVNVFAVNMPNVDAPGSNKWTDFRTTVAKIQTSTGYDFLSALPEAIQCKVEVRNCAPVVNAFPGATILIGETYTAQGTFVDAATDTWTGSANYGDGSVLPMSISGNSFQLSHQYTSAGIFTVTATVRDQLGAAGSATATVNVQSSLKGAQNLATMLSMANLSNANSLQAKLNAAIQQLANGNRTPAANQLGAFENELQAMVQSGRLSQADAAPLLAYAERVINSIG
jgi:DNA/RNA endonuclease G (NUC1)